MEPIHQSPNVDKLEPREGVGLDTVVIRLDLRGRAAELWAKCGVIIRTCSDPWSRYRTRNDAWVIRHTALGVQVACPRKSAGRELRVSCEVARLARAVREPWRGRHLNTDKVSGQGALNLLWTLLEDLRAAVGDAAPWQREEIEVIRLDPFCDFKGGDLSTFAAPPVVRRRRLRSGRRFADHDVVDLEDDEQLESDITQHSVSHYRCGGRRTLHREVTRIYDRGAAYSRTAELRGLARYEAEHGREEPGSAKRPLELAFLEDAQGVEQIAGVRAWRDEPIDLLDSCDPTLWVAILGERLTEQALVPGLRFLADPHDFFLALRAEGVKVNDAALYTLLASAGDRPLGLSAKRVRSSKKKVESQTRLRFGTANAVPPSERIWSILAATRLDTPSLEAYERVMELSRMLQLDPELEPPEVPSSPLPELEDLLEDIGERREGGEEVEQVESEEVEGEQPKV